jgi:hypothetical protein
MIKTIYSYILAILVVGMVASGCNKEDENSGEIGGCMDVNSPDYSSSATYDNETCQFLYVTDYEVTNYEDINWDLIVNVEADLYIKVKRQSSSSWEFSSNTIDNADPNTVQIWSAPTQFQLLNETYVWELFDADNPPLDTDDSMASGSFNPFTSVNNGVVVSESSDGHTTVKIHYSLY